MPPLGLEIVDAEAAPLRQISPRTYFGSGRVERLRERAEELQAGLVVVDAQLSPVQQRNLEQDTGAKVIDRTSLILEIFGLRAQTKEGKLQVELARQAYERSKLVRTWTHLERQRGGLGKTGGPGETQIELDRRIIADRIVKLKRELGDVGRTRGLQRSARARAGLPAVVLVRGWFPDRVGTAIGIASSGIGVGIFALVPLAQHIWDGTNSVPLTLDGVDCSTASVYSTIVKNGNVSSAAYFGNSSQVRFQENPTAGIQRPFIGGLATGKNGVTNYVRFRADTAVATNCKIRMVCDWVSHYPLGGSGIVAV